MTDAERAAYRRFRTGLTYSDVWQMLWIDSADRAAWRQKSRGVVLRLWRDIKRDMWEAFLGGRAFEDVIDQGRENDDREEVRFP